MEINAIIEKRQIYNRKILELVSVMIEKHPELRFCQILWALEIINKQENGEIIDNFYEESYETFSRIKNDYKLIAQEMALDSLFADIIEPKEIYEKYLEKGLNIDLNKEI